MGELHVALAQLAPCWLDRAGTLARVCQAIAAAGADQARLVCFGEAFVPGYPFWLEHTDGARFESPLQQRLFAHYADQAVRIERGDLDPVCDAARDQRCWVVLGIIERPAERGGHSLYASAVTIDDGGQIRNVHRKLMPTYEERLVWSPGDGHGLQTFQIDGFTLGSLNCWENWMPLARTALYAQGVDVHVALWPGNVRNTELITRCIALEGRAYALSVGALWDPTLIDPALPEADTLQRCLQQASADGGSCIAAPDGQWLLEPQAGEARLLTATLEAAAIRRARQNFDPCGHYSRPDVLQLQVNRSRQVSAVFDDSASGRTGDAAEEP